MARSFPHFRQPDHMDCGATCLRMVAAHHGRLYPLPYLRDLSHIDREGASLAGLADAAEHLGFQTLALQVPYRADGDEAGANFDVLPLPFVAHWEQNHFVVVYRRSQKHVWIADPARRGTTKIGRPSFARSWAVDAGRGTALLLETTPGFYQREDDSPPERGGFGYLFGYLRPFRRLLLQLAIGLFAVSIIQLLFPFLTQAVVDIGIENQDIGFIWLVLAAQLMLFIGQSSVQFIQSWIILHVGARLNVALITDFLGKLMRLPLGFFDRKMIGDLLQRINDHRRIEEFLTNSSLLILLSAFNLLIFGAVLLIYDGSIFLIFLIASLLYLGWITLFLKRRERVDFQRFQQLSDNRSALIELIQGMPEIKLQNSERKHRWHWAHIQAKLFRANMRSLAITQYQDAGARFITQVKDILITIVAAKAVIDGEMTLGMLLAVQYIVGQLNAPLQQLVTFVRTAQDARISLERLGEIHQREEEPGRLPGRLSIDTSPAAGDLRFEQVSFRYNALSGDVLHNIDLTIPKGKVTAIVGTSGSGKTTLVKLLLGFYPPTQGQIKVGNTPLAHLDGRAWRARCGAVLQDGYIFSKSIAENVAESESDLRPIDKARLLRAVRLANIQEWIESLPLGYNTQVGMRGNGLSQGQRQRLLIARAIYRDPDYLFFDEATNALDANNERQITDNLNQFFEGRTVIVVAHRLSTVRHADSIVVLERGRIVEWGDHAELIRQRGAYYALVKNQLELGD